MFSVKRIIFIEIISDNISGPDRIIGIHSGFLWLEVSCQNNENKSKSVKFFFL